MRTLEVNREPVRKVRLAQFSAASPKVARLVLDLSAPRALPHRRRRRRREDRLRRGRDARGRRPWPRSSREADAAAGAAGHRGAAVPRAVLPAPAPAPMPAPARSACRRPRPAAPGRVRAGHASTPGEKQFTGHPISLDFKDGDLQDIFRLFADISGLNIVVNPGVSGQGHAEAQRGALGPGPRPHPEGERPRLHARGQRHPHRPPRRPADARSRSAASSRRSARWPATCQVCTHAPLLRQGGGPRRRPAEGGRPVRARHASTLDPRTNTMIITRPARRTSRRRRTSSPTSTARRRQVEIEARIVVTSRNFTRDLGIQWGF